MESSFEKFHKAWKSLKNIWKHRNSRLNADFYGKTIDNRLSPLSLDKWKRV